MTMYKGDYSFIRFPGSKKVVIAGQHTVKAITILRDENVNNNRDLKPWHLKVRAKVLRHDTPLEVRRLAAGDNQFTQRNYNDIKISDWCKLFLDTNNNAKMEEHLAMAVRQVGYDRPASAVCNMPQ